MWLFERELRQIASFLSLATFRSDYEYKIQYEYDLWILNQLRSQGRRSSILLATIIPKTQAQW